MRKRLIVVGLSSLLLFTVLGATFTMNMFHAHKAHAADQSSYTEVGDWDFFVTYDNGTEDDFRVTFDGQGGCSVAQNSLDACSYQKEGNVLTVEISLLFYTARYVGRIASPTAMTGSVINDGSFAGSWEAYAVD